MNLNPDRKNHVIAVAGLLAYAVLNAFFLSSGSYALLGLPLLAVGFYILINYPRVLFFTVVFLTPFSVIYEWQYQATFFAPTEPIIVALMIMYIVKQFTDFSIDRRVWHHPVTLFILLYLLWLLVTTFTSTMPIVSLKYFFVRFWFTVVFYFMAMEIFRRYAEIKKFIWFLIIPLAMVVCYATLNHLELGLTREVSFKTARPFFKDHTIYGATMALLSPITFGLVFHPRLFGINRFWQIVALGIGLLLLLGTFLSFSRASWLSLIIACGVFVIFSLKIKFKTIFITLSILIGVIFIYRTEIAIFFKENKATHGSDIEQQIRSVYNITTDASNKERLNRWYSAFRMFKERPLFGFGPGTYMFKYAPFQREYQKTRISTNFGDVGNAHSEYLGPLANSGFLGMLLKTGIFLMTFFTGMQLYYKAPLKTVRITALFITLSLTTYYFHGSLNNFLQSDKAAVPFWGMTAIITAMDVYFNNSRGWKAKLPPAEEKAES